VAELPAEDGGGVLLVGTDNGSMHAIDLADHEVRWVYETPGRIRPPAIAHDGVAYFVNSRDQVYALDLRTGAWRWQYEQDFTSDFTVLGHAGLALVAAGGQGTDGEAGVVYACFDSGKVAALGATSGEALWLSSVAPPEGGDFVDCDATPLVDPARNELWVTGQSTGVHSLSTEDGTVGWVLPMRGGGSVRRGPDGALLVASSLEGVVSLDPSGTMRWRAVTDPGVVSDPVVVDGTIFVTHSEIGLLAFDYDDGEMLAQLRTGSGMASTPVYDPVRDRLYAVSNRGLLISLRVGGALDQPFADEPATAMVLAP
jgi:outer membrane protein assembly factor BamB